MNACFFTPSGIGFLFGFPALASFATVFMLLEISCGRPVLWMGRPLLEENEGPV